jgi:acetyl-CoA C-acetyltransferase
MREVVIVAAKRTPIARYLGSFSEVTAVELGTVVTKAILKEIPIEPREVDEVIFGNAVQAGNRPNPARQIAYFSGIPVETPAHTINMACASSIKAIALGYQSIVFEDADIVIAGGTENMTRRPFILDTMRFGYRLGHSKVIDGMYHDGLVCPLCGEVMGKTAENLVERYQISRRQQDEYASMSQTRCEKATAEGKFRQEIVPVQIKDKTVVEDENPRKGVTVESLAKLPPVFKKDGTVHAGNACGLADGACAVMLMSEQKARQKGIIPFARIIGYSSVGVDPRFMGIGPVPAVHKLEKRTKVGLKEYDLIELNEAFAAQVLACHRELGFDLEKTNVNGGAIALGHPIAATGARIVTTLLYEMMRRGAKNGLATLCTSGGLGMAMSFQRV